MLEYIQKVNEVIGEYYPLISTAFGLLAALFTVIRIAFIFKDKAAKKEARITDIEKRLYHLDDPKTGRVHKLSRMVETQIETNKRALAISAYNKGQIDQINNRTR